MQIFDAPDRNFCTVKRTLSSSPLQALVLLNDPQFIEASRSIALRMLQEGGDKLNNQLSYGFRLVTGRLPNTKEMKLLRNMYNVQQEHYQKNIKKAEKILSIGEAPLPKNVRLVETASFADIALALINTDEFFTRK